MSLDREYFDALYERRADPWRLSERWYEERKRALTVASLPHQRYASAVEIGCSIGTLSELLIDRCDQLLATDISSRAIDIARERTGDRPGLTFSVSDATRDWPRGDFSLIVLSEIGYYLSAEHLDAVLDNCVRSLSSDAVLLACHWRHPVGEYPVLGDAVHDRIRARPELVLLGEYLDDDFRLELFQPGSTESVASREGLL